MAITIHKATEKAKLRQPPILNLDAMVHAISQGFPLAVITILTAYIQLAITCEAVDTDGGDRMDKKYIINREEIERLLPDIGYGLITDRITVDGIKIGYMKRSDPVEDGDSGWAFFSGDESQEYLSDPTNISVMSLNSIANFDPEIISYITYPTDSIIERINGGPLVPTTPQNFKPQVRFLPPISKGLVKLIESWSFNAPDYMLRRVDHGDLVVWRPGLTVYISIFTLNETNPGQEATLFTEGISPNAENITRHEQDGLIKITYDLSEGPGESHQKGIYLGGFSEGSMINAALYYNSDADREMALSIASSIKPNCKVE